MRPVLPVLAVSAALALALAGCSNSGGGGEDGGNESAAKDCTPVAAGAASDAVGVSGDLGAEPEVDIETPVSVKETQRTVVTEGDGEVVEEGSTANVQFSLYNATSGEVATSTGYEEGTEQPVLVDAAQFLPGLVKTVQCSTVGSRVVGVVPPADAFGDQGYADFKIAAEDSLVFVIDVVSLKQPAKAVEWTDDVPKVEYDDKGVPTVTLPKTDPPKELLLTTLEEGDGAVVKDGDSVTVNYQGTSWDTGEVFDESFTKDPVTFSTSGVIEGFTAALVGQKVGSTVLVSIPPELGYGTDPEAQALGGQTLVFLIEIQKVGAAGE